ncbi:UNVERIFIED_CONTAM: hypothetical protein GTU68_046970 [Idotea baltica]|nr:hypothetical protein [Idotea baltica]
MTNRGALVLELEEKLRNYLNLKNITLTTNGTLPIQIAIKALNLTGEIITTPFSYVATTSTIVWEGCKPVFVDIHPEYLTIDETKIESAITEQTSAILATHVFGNPCHVVAIEAIAKKHNLKVVYDAAHCFGVNYKDKSIFGYGDVSTCSFHATKLFHTGEGGAMFANDKVIHDALYYHHNFGHDGHEAFHGMGINAKISELQAAMGLSVFPYFETILEERKKIVDAYNKAFEKSNLQLLKIRSKTKWNYCYYPIIFKNEDQLLKVKIRLEKNLINTRRYFYPSLDTLPYVNADECLVSRKIASSVLCLPLYVGLSKMDTDRIINIVKSEVC